MNENDKDLFCKNCGRQITIDDIETTHEGEQGCAYCISECSICEYKEFDDNMYDRLVRKGDNWNRGLVCFDCENNEDNELKPAPIRVFEALGEIFKI